MHNVRNAHLFLSPNKENDPGEDRERIDNNRAMFAELIEKWAGRRAHDGWLHGDDPRIVVALADRVVTLTEEVERIKDLLARDVGRMTGLWWR